VSARLSIIPAGAVTDERLEPRDLQVLCLLGRHTDKQGWCVRSQVKMAAELHCGRSSVQRSLENLVNAGWVQKKQRGVPEGHEPGQPSASYAYRVILDRDDYAFEAATRDDVDDEASHAEDASISAEGVPTGGHPGAQPARAPGAHTYVGTNNDPLERSHLERERDARARDRNARFIVAFEQRWPTSAADSAQRTAYAAEALTEDEQQAALAGIGPFLDELKRHKRKHVPSGFTYLEERRWTKLPQRTPEMHATAFPAGGEEGKALAVLYEIAGKTPFFRATMVRGGNVYYRGTMEPRLLALARADATDRWVTLDRRQAAAWEDLLRTYVTVQVRNRLVEGARAPWPWPPSVEGKIYDTAAPPVVLQMPAGDDEALANGVMR
jgi:Helix-turn-helix domain